MTKFKSEFLRILRERGFIHQCTDETNLDELLQQNIPKVGYIGFDCTADSLHVGSLIQIMLLRWYQKSGHKPIVLMGGGTTKVGDPSGKDELRQIITEDAITANMKSIQRIFENFLSFEEGPAGALVVNNADWLNQLESVSYTHLTLPTKA